ncbi:alpha/beta fold hydrolase [Candidatus Magnetaquicoccus inordinatus]|uniref:alpha/beta fold hydrolase n=1 Tax=Candidatus Magnetaquicoccus inordinatus TaxID=2496818 RepID=UPI00102C876C|nr:alpha/beta hydrolase [Candidatus Magnetaquicoccus inordinatus]
MNQDAFLPVWDQMGDAGEAVLCLSGFASSNWLFRLWLQDIQGSFRFLLPENRGMGRAAPATAPYLLDDLAKDAVRLLDHLALAQVTVIGLSMGGFVAQRLFALAPERVKRMVLLCTSSGGEEFQPLLPLMSREQVTSLYQLDAETRIHAALSPQICPLLQEHYPQLFAEVFRQRLIHQENLQQILFQYDAVAKFLRQRQPLEQINCPVLILAGEQDLLVPLANAQLLAKKIAHSQLAVIPDSDHLFFLEQAEMVNRVLLDWLLRRQ